jgi:transposase InsO family protein
VVAEVLADFTDRGSEFSSVCVAVCDRAGAAAFHGSIGSCLDNAVAESFFATLKASSSTARLPTRRSASLDLPLPWRARSRSSAEGLGIAGGGRTVTDP